MDDGSSAMNRAGFEQLLGIYQSREVQQAIATVREIAGFELPETLREPFLYFHAFITKPPAYIESWRANPKTEHWYIKHVDGVLTSTQQALSACYYHADRLKAMESEIVAALSSIDFEKAIPSNSAVGVGGTSRMDFEYHAFVFAARRMLDYLTRGLASYFKQEFHSFHSLPKVLGRFSTNPVGIAILAARERSEPRATFVMSEGADRSIRDLIAHYKHIDVGTVNLTSRGLSFAGGGENLKPGGDVSFTAIGDAIDARLNDLQSIVSDVLHSFVDAARAVDEEQSSSRE